MKKFTILAILMVIPVSLAYGENQVIDVFPVEGSGSDGCQNTFEGCYSPDVLFIDVSDIVIFHNTDSAAHTITSGNPDDGPNGLFDSALVMPGNSFEYSPTTTGQIDYFCMVHPWMVGVIIVDGEIGETFDDFDFDFEEFDIEPIPDNNHYKNENIRLQNELIFLQDKYDDEVKKNYNLKADYKKVSNHNLVLASQVENLQNIVNEQIRIIMETLVSLKS